MIRDLPVIFISTLYLATALRDNGGGRIITTEFEPEEAARARANLLEAGLLDLAEIRERGALQTLAEGLPKSLDGSLEMSTKLE